jgi:hypothetical protein
MGVKAGPLMSLELRNAQPPWPQIRAIELPERILQMKADPKPKN